MQKSIVFVLFLALAANAQRIETEKSDRHKVIRVETAPNHLSVIELAEPITEVAAGSSSYRIEWRGNKVFIQPLDSDATTNLFIWTSSERLSYELVPAPSVHEMSFAIDQEPGPKIAKIAVPQRPPEDQKVNQAATLASEMMFGSTPVHLSGVWKDRNCVQIILKDIYRDKSRMYVRYAIQNKGQATYVPGEPGVFDLRSPRSSRSLYALSHSQLVGDGIRIKCAGKNPVPVVQAEVHANAVAPGGTTWGLVGFDWPSTAAGPTVLKFEFPADGVHEIAALLVL
jgi:hypothetical protein